MIRLLMSLCVIVILAASQPHSAELDPTFGKADTCTVEVDELKPGHWTLTVSYANQHPLSAIAIPLKYNAGLARLVADSAVFTGGRVEHFEYKAFRCDTAIQVLTVGLVGSLAGTSKKLTPGRGRLATIFLSARGTDKIGPLVVDSTTSHPSTSLEAVGHIDTWKMAPGEQLTAEMVIKLSVKPAFVIRKAE